MGLSTKMDNMENWDYFLFEHVLLNLAVNLIKK